MPHPRDTVTEHAIGLVRLALSIGGELRITTDRITLLHAPADRDNVDQAMRHLGLLDLDPPMMLGHHGQTVELEVVEVAPLPVAPVAPADPWGPVLTVWGLAKWRTFDGWRRLYVGDRDGIDFIAEVSTAEVDGDYQWFAFAGRIGRSAECNGKQATEADALRAALDALRELGSLPPVEVAR
jgi:hypothetical protein